MQELVIVIRTINLRVNKNGSSTNSVDAQEDVVAEKMARQCVCITFFVRQSYKHPFHFA